MANLKEIAKAKKWSFVYNQELDQLYFSPSTIGKKYVLHTIDDEYNIYVDKRSNVGGIFIEYFKTNLTEHDEKYKEFKNTFSKNVKEGKTVPKSKEKEAVYISEFIRADILSKIAVSQKKTVLIPA